MANKQVNNELYKKLICDMIQDLNDGKFLRQVYSLLFRERNRTGRLQRELYSIIDNLEGEDLRLLYVAAIELQRK